MTGWLSEDPTDDVAAWLDLSQENACEASPGKHDDVRSAGEAESRGVSGVVVAVGAMVLALLVALACFVWLGPQEKRAAAAATASRVASLFWLSGGAGLVSEGEHQRRQVHGYFWATDPDGRGSANASAAEGIAREFARSLSEHPGLLDALVVVHAVRTRVVIDSDDAALSYMLVEPLHTDPADSLRGIPPPALDALWREARRQGIKLYGGYVCMHMCVCMFKPRLAVPTILYLGPLLPPLLYHPTYLGLLLPFVHLLALNPKPKPQTLGAPYAVMLAVSACCRPSGATPGPTCQRPTTSASPAPSSRGTTPRCIHQASGFR